MSMKILILSILIINIISKEMDAKSQEELNTTENSNTSTPQPSTSTEQKEKEEIEEKVEESTIEIKEEEQVPKYITFPIPYENNEDFLVTALGIGTPRTYFPVQVDTSTSTTWIPSTKCSNCKSYLKYNSSLSNTSFDSSNTIELFDEDGNLKGLITHDDVQVDQYILKNFTFVQAKELQENYRDFEDGKLGLGYYHSNKEMSFIEMLKENKLIDNKVFSIKELNDSFGEITIGKYPSEENYTYCNVSSTEDLDNNFKESWLCKLSFISINNVKNNETLSQEKIVQNMIELDDSLISFDTASSYIIAPYEFISTFENEFFDKYYKGICRKTNNANDIVFLCNKIKFSNETIMNITNELTLSFVIEGISYDLEVKKLFEVVDRDNVEFFVHFRKYANLIWNIGHPFVHDYTLIFDGENGRVGLIGKYTDVSTQLEKISNTFWKQLINKEYLNYALIVGGILLGLILLFLVYRCIRRRSKDNNEKISLVPNENKD